MIVAAYVIFGGMIMTKEKFILKAREKHGDKYDYSKVEYVNNHTKVCIICPEHGEFWQVPNSHLNGNGCPLCAGLKKRTTETFIQKAKEIHGDKYDYSKVNYINKRSKVIIICPEHGEFEQCANNHLRGQGCPECGKIKAQNRIGDFKNFRKTKEDFQNDLNKLYNGQYEIVGDYINNKTKTEIYCHKIGKNGKEHGIFVTRPDGLINGHGCPKCGNIISKGENEIYEFISQIYNDNIIKHDRTLLNGKELDIYIPSLKIGIEYNGLLWHSDKFRNKKDILEKFNLCQEKGIFLITIYEDEWNNKKEICKSRISGFLRKNDRIFARKCEIKEISYKESSLFLDNNHLQGNCISKYNLGLFYNNQLISVMTFGNLRKNLGNKSQNGAYEMLRFCNKIGINVIGGASKLLSYFIKKYNPKEIISYADRRWSKGNLYTKLGFELDKVTPQNYFYIPYNGLKRINRFSLRKNILVEKYGCPKDMTEKEFCKRNGYYRVYDCGNLKFIWKNKENLIN